ncbi:hypothetical protein A8924_0638 [Saccharopolyspora erythraea NRRL 2338]|uniref:Uncharacterized protein n=2 Tax=Saccharopolyspora erythraea TaxID=1836 RepID=A4F6C1_SACEN|nr:hypothetical protein [Saccharopolyspora erythraea]PFG93398.1 hypothetical protein A8924_0638 [Saccharopolyspora erythraea NRRL 2338]QRK90229.1 hypothetical protein JQX30_01240 [Saccharopolyspora erythraea]QRK90247.1 hypothetical protein JQX30_01400 [Saccharopolyspora erythraea]QRK90254.1 hypothetical protein JQX30_01465 [Saccharopolyspora erythraea]QRK90261.1 hypothetical protein JQX30_01530 [Saccharopolyspora erythraea]
MTASKVPVHGVVTVLYACPLTDAQLRDAEVSDLARFVALVHRTTPRKVLGPLEQGLAVLAESGGPSFDRRRYALAQARADAIRALMPAPGRDTSAEPPPVHPVEIEPDAIWPN